MIFRLSLFCMMAIALVGFGAVSWVFFAKPPGETVRAEEAKVAATKTVLAAGRTIHAGALLKPEDLTSKQIASDDPGENSSNPDTPEMRRGLVGAMVRRTLSAGDVVRNEDVMRPGDHGFLAAVLEPNMRAVTIAVDNTSGSAGLIWPGDRVDLILTQSLQDTKLPLGRRVAAETVLTNARVIAIDQQLIQGAVTTPDSQAKTATLEVTEEEAERISVATRLGRLSLSVRSAALASSNAPQAGINTTWAVDVSPALGATTAPPPDNVIRVFQGGGEIKEFKY